MPNVNVCNRDILLHYKDGGLRHVSELHRGIAVSIAFPNGWHVNLKLQDGKELTALVVTLARKILYYRK